MWSGCWCPLFLCHRLPGAQLAVSQDGIPTMLGLCTLGNDHAYHQHEYSSVSLHITYK